MTTSNRVNSRRLDVAVLGGLNVDYLIHGGPLPRPGETTVGSALSIGSGGKGGNQAVGVARLGGRVAMIGLVGDDDAGRRLVAELVSEGVSTACVMISDTHQTGSAVIMVDTHGEKQIMVAPGANGGLLISNVRSAEPTIATTSVLVTQLEVPLDATIEACQIARESETIVILDAATASPLPSELLVNVDIIRCNAHEAEAITSIPVTDESTAMRATDVLMRYGVEVAIVQAGYAGDLVRTSRDSVLLRRIPVNAIDNTGAGDAFVAALALEIARGESIVQAARFANGAAALATTVVGARGGLPGRDAVNRIVAGIDAANS